MFNFDAYNLEVVRFLHTLTIKYDPWVEHYNTKYPGIVTDGDESTYPYYINIQGRYHSEEDPVVTTNGIELSRPSLDANPLLRISFKNDFARIFKLYNDYPSQIEVLRTAIWPVNKTETEIISSGNLSLLGYDSGYLDSNEREDIVAHVQKLLVMLRDRWYNPYFFGEDLFHSAWWSTMWFLLFTGIHTRRLENIQQETAHNSHVKEELLSHGFPECKLMLNRTITMFLYKNYRYLDKHKGKNSLLEIIDEHILSKVGYTLNKYKIIKRTGPDLTEKKWVPDVVLSDMDDVIDKNETMDQESFRLVLVNQGFSPLEISSVEKQMRLNKITNNPFNELDTKYLLLNESASASIYSNMFYSMVFELLISMWYHGEAKIAYNFETEIMNTDFDVNVSAVNIIDLIYMFHYCVNTAIGNTVTNLPTEYDGCLRVRKESDIQIPETIFFAENKLQLKSYVDPDDIMTQMFSNGDLRPVKTRIAYYNLLQPIFSTYVACIQNMKGTADAIRIIGYEAIIAAIFTKEKVEIVDPNGMTTYSEYFASRTDLKSILDLYPTSDDLLNIANNIVNNLINVDVNFHPFVSKRTSNSSISCLLNILRRFTSYNVNYIQGVATEKKFALLPKISVGCVSRESSLDRGVTDIDGFHIRKVSSVGSITQDVPLSYVFEKTSDDGTTQKDRRYGGIRISHTSTVSTEDKHEILNIEYKKLKNS